MAKKYIDIYKNKLIQFKEESKTNLIKKNFISLIRNEYSVTH